MDHSKKSTYLFSIDALRVIAIIAVVVIHVTTKTLQNIDHNISDALITFFLNQSSRFAVPLFFLISGFVLELNHKDKITYKIYFKKRAARILLPYIFWSSLYFIVGWNFDLTKILSFRFLSDLIYGSAAYHLYFIPTLVLFYLVFPIIHRNINFFSKKYTLIILALLQTSISFKDYYFGQIPLQYSLRIAVLNIIIFILGMVASRYHEELFKFVKRNFKYFLTFLIIVLSYLLIHVFKLTTNLRTTGYIYNQYGPLYFLYMFILTSSLFTLFEKTRFLKKTFIQLSHLSFFVFFIHVLVLEKLWSFNITQFIKLYGSNFLKNNLFDPLVILIVTSLSFVVAYLVHKIPNASKITG